MNRAIYLITGPSGAGKTTLSEYLDSKGYTTVDADSTPGLSYYVNKNNKPVPYPAGADAGWWATHNYVWELDRLAKLIDGLQPSDGNIFLSGNAGNIKKAWPMFKTVFYLDIPQDIMLTRIAGGEANHNFGQRVEDRNQLVRWAEPFKEEMLALGAVTIDATKPVDKVATSILSQVKANATA
jgi:hypothetical protein